MATKPGSQPSQAYNPSYTSIVDYNSVSGNFLFRGNLPLLMQSPYYYAYDLMNTQMQQLISALPSDVNPPSSFNLQNYTLLDINLLDNQGDYEDWDLVCNNFGVDTSQFPQKDWPPYSFITPWQPSTVLGTGTVSASSSNSYTGNMLWWPFEPGFNEFSNGFQFNGLVEYAYNALYAPSTFTGPTVVYVHCDSGVNRTGAFVVSYLLTYGSSLYTPITTLEEAYTTADAMVPQDQAPASTYFPMITAYCNLLDNSNLGCSYTPSSS